MDIAQVRVQPGPAYAHFAQVCPCLRQAWHMDDGPAASFKAAAVTLQVDEIIERLLEVRNGRGKQVQLAETDIRMLCLTAKEIFMSQPNLLELEAPIKICGAPGSNDLCPKTLLLHLRP